MQSQRVSTASGRRRRRPAAAERPGYASSGVDLNTRRPVLPVPHLKTVRRGADPGSGPPRAKFRRRFSAARIAAHRRAHSSRHPHPAGGTSGGVVSTAVLLPPAAPRPGARGRGARGAATPSTRSTRSQASPDAGPGSVPSSSSRLPSRTRMSNSAATARGALRSSSSAVGERRARSRSRGRRLAAARPPCPLRRREPVAELAQPARPLLGAREGRRR